MSKISKIRVGVRPGIRNALLAGVCGLVIAMPAHAQLEQALRVAKSSTAASAASQQRVEDADDAAESAARDYRAVLQQIDNMKLFVDQQDIYLRGQAGDIESLTRQLGSVEQVKRGMVPMMLRMAAEIEDSVKGDVPFRMIERKARLKRMKDTLADPTIAPTEQYRQVLNAFKVEVSYGQGIESYEGAHPTAPGNVVNFIRFGRVALVYMTKDESEIRRYNMETGDWDELSTSEGLSMRQAIRIAKGESAPSMVTAPVFKR